MIDSTLDFLKNRLLAFLKAQEPLASTSTEDPLLYVNLSSDDAISFTLGKVSMLLVSVQEETAVRSADPYSRVLPNGNTQRVQPEIHLNLFVMFAARYNKYADGLKMLSRVIQYFQMNRVYTRASEADLPPSLHRIVVELNTLPFAEQNELWSSLRSPYLPSVLYKIKMLVIQDDIQPQVPDVIETRIHLDEQ